MLACSTSCVLWQPNKAFVTRPQSSAAPCCQQSLSASYHKRKFSKTLEGRTILRGTFGLEPFLI